MAYQANQRLDAVDQYLAQDRKYRVAHARWVEDQRRLVITRGRLLRKALDSTNIATMTKGLRLSTSRLYQLMALRGRQATTDDPATPLDAVLQPVAGSKLPMPTTWGAIRTKIEREHADTLADQWFRDWRAAYEAAGLDPDLVDGSHLNGRFDRWWFHLAPQTIEAAFGVVVK